ncbi:MAG: hypothetical protein WD766_13010 [Gemmatimonadota bacterium]
MSGISIDVTVVAGILVGGLLLLVPLAGLTLRYGVIPLISAIGELRRSWIHQGKVELAERTTALEARVSELEYGTNRDEPGVRFA